MTLGTWRVAMQTLATLTVSFALVACAGDVEPTDSVPTSDGLTQPVGDEKETTSAPAPVPARETSTPSPNKGRSGIGLADDQHEEIKRPPE